MSNRSLIFAMLFFLSHTAVAQELIAKKDGERVEAKILDMDSTEVRYKRTDYIDGPTYTILKSDIHTIQYPDGRVDTIKAFPPAAGTTMADPYAAGVRDAKRYYDSYKGAGTVTLVAGLLSPTIALIPAIACSSTPPRTRNLDYPDSNLMTNPEYERGYRQKAKKIKQGKVWKNFGIAIGVNIAAFLLLSAAQ